MFDRPREDVTWEALATIVDCEPGPGGFNDFQMILVFPEEFTFELAEAWENLNDLNSIPRLNSFPEYRRKSIRDLAMGPNQFTLQPTLLLVLEAHPSHQADP
jgi:hypothetical protein